MSFYERMFVYKTSNLKRRMVTVKDYGSPSEDSSQDEGDTEVSIPASSVKTFSQMDMQNWIITKCMKYMRNGDQNACIMSLCTILDCDLYSVDNQIAVAQNEGLEMLVNLLEAKHLRCRISVVHILSKITTHPKIALVSVYLGIVPILCDLLCDVYSKEEVVLVCKIIKNIAPCKRAARGMRRRGGIEVLVLFLNIRKEILLVDEETLTPEEARDIELAKVSCDALTALAKYRKNQLVLMKTGVVPYISEIIVTGHKVLAPAAIGILCECAALGVFQEAIEDNGLVGVLLCDVKVTSHNMQFKYLRQRSEQQELRISENSTLWHQLPIADRRCLRVLVASAFPVVHMLWEKATRESTAARGSLASSATSRRSTMYIVARQFALRESRPSALPEPTRPPPEPDARRVTHQALRTLQRAARSENVRRMIWFHGGLSVVATVLDPHNTDKELVAAALGVLGKCAISQDMIGELERMGLNRKLVRYLDQYDVYIRMMAAGGIAEMAKKESCREELVELNIIPRLVKMLQSPSQPWLLANSALGLNRMAQNKEALKEIIYHDGLRLLWLLLNNDHREVKVQAAWALESCLRNAEDSGELVRSVTGSLLVLTNLLQTNDLQYLAAICSMIALVVEDDQNLNILAEGGLVWLLYNALIRADRHHEPNALREDPIGVYAELANAVANVCRHEGCSIAFGQMGGIPLLVRSLCTRDRRLKKETTRALHVLSNNMLNCLAMHSCDVVPILLHAVSSECIDTEKHAAGCLANIRRVLLTCDNGLMRKSCEPKEQEPGDTPMKRKRFTETRPFLFA